MTGTLLSGMIIKYMYSTCTRFASVSADKRYEAPLLAFNIHSIWADLSAVGVVCGCVYFVMVGQMRRPG